ncbi:MAG: hypothetical protein MUF06_15030 [Pirellulaceae bacterium]|nr:hypothetical protein [Pirellulaceae bacterium]
MLPKHHAPQVQEPIPERARLERTDIEQPVGTRSAGCEPQTARISRQVDDKDPASDERFGKLAGISRFSRRVLHPQFRIVVLTYRIENRFGVRQMMNIAGPAAMQPANHFGVEAAAGHQYKQAITRSSRIEGDRTSRCDQLGEPPRIGRQLQILGKQVLGSERQDGNRHSRGDRVGDQADGPVSPCGDDGPQFAARLPLGGQITQFRQIGDDNSLEPDRFQFPRQFVGHALPILPPCARVHRDQYDIGFLGNRQDRGHTALS